MKRLFFFAFLSSLYLPVTAQIYTYFVKGEAYLQMQNETKKLSQEVEIKKGQTVILRQGAHVILFNEVGQQISLDRAGSYPYNTLRSELLNRKDNLTQKYLSYLWKGLNKKKKSPEQLRNKPIAGVSRGDELRIISPSDSAIILQEPIVFSWSDINSPTIFTLADEENSPLIQLELSSSSLSVNFAVSQFPGNKIYHWWVNNSENTEMESAKQTIILLNRTTQKDFEQEMVRIHAITAIDSVSNNISNITEDYLKTWALERIKNKR